jgi:hypothetical protein
MYDYFTTVLPNLRTWPNSSSLHNIFQEVVSKIIPPIMELNTSQILLNFVDKLFDLHESSFMRRRLVWMIKVMVQFTGTQTLDVTIQDMCSPASFAGHIDLITQLLAGYRPPQPNQVLSPEAFIEQFNSFISHYAGSAFGQQSCESAVLKLSLLLQSPIFLHHFVYTFLDVMLIKMYPDIVAEIRHIHCMEPMQPIETVGAPVSTINGATTRADSTTNVKLFQPNDLSATTKELVGVLNPQFVHAMKYNEFGLSSHELAGTGDIIKPPSVVEREKKKLALEREREKNGKSVGPNSAEKDKQLDDTTDAVINLSSFFDDDSDVGSDVQGDSQGQVAKESGGSNDGDVQTESNESVFSEFTNMILEPFGYTNNASGANQVILTTTTTREETKEKAKND